MRAMGKMILLFIVAVTFFLSTTSAHALLTLRLSDGTTIFDVEDGSEDDIYSDITGVISYSGIFSGFKVNVTTGVQDGTNSQPILGINSFEVSKSSGGTLTALLSNVDFGPTSSPAGYAMHSTGNAIKGSGALHFYSYIDNGNILFSESTALGAHGSAISSGTWSADISGEISSLANPYSVTSKAVITLSGNSIIQSTTNVAIVPEPISSTLFLVGAATLGFRRFRKNLKG